MRRHSRLWDPDSDPGAESRGFNPPVTRRWWRDGVLPWTVVPLAWLTAAILAPAALTRSRRMPSGAPVVAVESGLIGWTHVSYEELRQSLSEYVPEARIVPVAIDRDKPYRPQARAWSRDRSLTHAVIDPRTGPQRAWRAWADTVALAWNLRRGRVTPIVILTDASLRRHRAQAAILTMYCGVVVTFMDSALVRRAFPHRRIIGPLPMAISQRRLEWLQRLHATPATTADVHFIGGVYPPRAQFLERLGTELDARGITLTIHADKYGTSNDDYWTVLATSPIVVTTTMQGMPRRDMDWIWTQQLVFRFSEALAAGAVLVAPVVAGGDRYFRAGEDFVPFTSVGEAADAVELLVRDRTVWERVRSHGHQTATNQIREHAFWRDIDAALGARSIAR